MIKSLANFSCELRRRTSGTEIVILCLSGHFRSCSSFPALLHACLTTKNDIDLVMRVLVWRRVSPGGDGPRDVADTGKYGLLQRRDRLHEDPVQRQGHRPPHGAQL
ncbi:unnamed protein product [Ectocarpus sp. 12 AP-2014]